MIPQLRTRFNQDFTPAGYLSLLALLEQRCGVPVEYRIAESPVFLPLSVLEGMAQIGADLTRSLIGDTAYLNAARDAIPANYRVGGETAHPHFLTADFAFVQTPEGELAPRLVEIQAFPSIYAFQVVLCSAYQESFQIPGSLGCFLTGLDEGGYWEMVGRTIRGDHDPENVVLTEIDPLHQKTRPDFEVTSRRLGIPVVDIRTLEPVGNTLHYRQPAGRLIPIRRIYNRAIADELISRNIQLPFDLTRDWDVEWAGHPNWYFLISKFSIPRFSRRATRHSAVPPAVFLNDFLGGDGREQLAEAGVPMPAHAGPDTVYSDLLLKPLFSFAGRGILFDPTQGQLEQIPLERREEYLLQQRMSFVPTIDTPQGMTQAEVRILYLWPDGEELTPALSLVRLGRGKMMGVDHNRNQAWVGASAALYPIGGRAR